MLEPAAPIGSDTPTYTRNRAKRRAIIASIITGTTIEWYDFYLYGWLFPAMQPHFFPTSNPVSGWLTGLALYATGFVIRPVGAAYFGRLGISADGRARSSRRSFSWAEPPRPSASFPATSGSAGSLRHCWF